MTAAIIEGSIMTAQVSGCRLTVVLHMAIGFRVNPDS